MPVVRPEKNAKIASSLPLDPRFEISLFPDYLAEDTACRLASQSLAMTWTPDNSGNGGIFVWSPRGPL
jgi:hypothetical protein